MEEALKFVIFCMEDMQGGELYVPKLKSSLIGDLAKSINEKHKIQYTGIRPGEKIDESLISPDEVQNVIEFKLLFGLSFYPILETDNFRVNFSKKEKS